MATQRFCSKRSEIMNLKRPLSLTLPMNIPACSPAFRRQHLLAAKQLLRIAIAPAKAGTTCRNVRSMGGMREGGVWE